ncbi:MAG: hypothetical protein WBQ64_12255 [Terriglobales bacterium]
MKKPFLRVTKWLGDIPVEAECMACADTKFRVNSTSHRPSREEYQKTLQREFDHHVKTVHMPEDAGKGAPGS